MKSALRSIVVIFVTASGSASAFPIDSNNIYQVNSEATVGSSDYRTTVVAYCNDGDVVVSGGCYNFAAPAKLLQSLQWANGWLCNYDNTQIGYPEYPPIIPTVYVVTGNPPIRASVVYCAHP